MKVICYLSNGYKNQEETIKAAENYIKGGCDIIEIDLPSNNAFLDSDYISDRMKEALKNEPSYDKHFETILKIRQKHPEQKMMLLAYEHTIKDIGTDKFIEKVKELNIQDVILIAPEDDIIKNKLIENNLKVACYVQYDLPQEEVEAAKKTNGFIYLQAKPTGKIKEGFETLKSLVQYLKSQGINNPIYCGVGISTKDDIKMVEQAGGDAAFVGSAILKLQDNEEELIKFIKELKS